MLNILFLVIIISLLNIGISFIKYQIFKEDAEIYRSIYEDNY